MANVVPEFVQLLLVQQLVSDLHKGNLVSAAANARNILQLAQASVLLPAVVAVAQRTVGVLEQRGYSERRFLQEMASVAQANPPCPADALPVQADGTCPAGYFPLFANLQDSATRRCCAKMRQEVQRMDTEVREMRDQLDTTDLQMQFQERFMVTDPVTARERDEMLGVGITPHVSRFLDRYKTSETERLERKVEEIERKQATVADVFGEKMTPSLYEQLKKKLGSAKAFVVWYVNHDFTYNWICIYIFRFVALFGCMFLQVGNSTNQFYAFWAIVVKQFYGIIATADYVQRTLMPNILSVLMGSGFLTAISRGLLHFGGWITNVLGTVSLTGRLLSLFQQAGFSIDVYFILKDVWAFGWSFATTAAATIQGGNYNPLEIAANSLYAGTANYCNSTIKTFFALTANMVGGMTRSLFAHMCRSITHVTTTMGGEYANFLSKTFCDNFARIVDAVIKSFGGTETEGPPGETLSGFIDRMASSGVTSNDLLQRAGTAPPPPSPPST